MSESSKKGVSLEQDIARTLRSKLKVQVQRDSRSGAGDTVKTDIRDRYFNETRLAIEAKNQQTIQLKSWWRQTKQSASMGQIPTLVFKADEEILATVPFAELVDLVAEIKQLEKQLEELRAPVVTVHPQGAAANPKLGHAVNNLADAVTRSIQKGATVCRNGHLVDQEGLCLTKGCPYGRYRPKVKRAKA